MTDDLNDEEALDVLFKAARDNSVAPRHDFIARLNADADANVSTQAVPPEAQKTPLWAQFAQYWIPASGLTAATVLGVWIGMLLPETQIAAEWLSDDASDVNLTAFLPGADLSQFTDPESDG
jgi:hypothetical protein